MGLSCGELCGALPETEQHSQSLTINASVTLGHDKHFSSIAKCPLGEEGRISPIQNYCLRHGAELALDEFPSS